MNIWIPLALAAGTLSTPGLAQEPASTDSEILAAKQELASAQQHLKVLIAQKKQAAMAAKALRVEAPAPAITWQTIDSADGDCPNCGSAGETDAPQPQISWATIAGPSDAPHEIRVEVEDSEGRFPGQMQSGSAKVRVSGVMIDNEGRVHHFGDANQEVHPGDIFEFEGGQMRAFAGPGFSGTDFGLAAPEPRMNGGCDCDCGGCSDHHRSAAPQRQEGKFGARGQRMDRLRGFFMGGGPRGAAPMPEHPWGRNQAPRGQRGPMPHGLHTQGQHPMQGMRFPGAGDQGPNGHWLEMQEEHAGPHGGWFEAREQNEGPHGKWSGDGNPSFGLFFGSDEDSDDCQADCDSGLAFECDVDDQAGCEAPSLQECEVTLSIDDCEAPACDSAATCDSDSESVQVFTRPMLLDDVSDEGTDAQIEALIQELTASGAGQVRVITMGEHAGSPKGALQAVIELDADDFDSDIMALEGDVMTLEDDALDLEIEALIQEIENDNGAEVEVELEAPAAPVVPAAPAAADDASRVQELETEVAELRELVESLVKQLNER